MTHTVSVLCQPRRAELKATVQAETRHSLLHQASSHMNGSDSPTIALVRQLLIALLAIVLAGACWIEQILSSDEVHPSTNLKQSSRN